MSLIDDKGAATAPTGPGDWEDSLFKTIDPTWTDKAEVLSVQRMIAIKVMSPSGIEVGSAVGITSEEGPLLPGSTEAVRLMTSAPAQLLRSSGPDRRRSRRRRRRSGFERTVMVGRVVARDDDEVGLVLAPPRMAIGEDELVMRVPIRDLPDNLRSGLMIGVVFDFITTRWITPEGKVLSESEFRLREPREFTPQEQRSIERRAAELRRAIGEPSTDPIL